MERQLFLVQQKMSEFVKDKKEYFTKLYDKIYDFRNKLEYRVPKKKLSESASKETLTPGGDVNKLIDMYKKMVKSGEMEEHKKKHAAIQDKHRRKKLAGFEISQKG